MGQLGPPSQNSAGRAPPTMDFRFLTVWGLRSPRSGCRPAHVPVAALSLACGRPPPLGGLARPPLAGHQAHGPLLTSALLDDHEQLSLQIQSQWGPGPQHGNFGDMTQSPAEAKVKRPKLSSSGNPSTSKGRDAPSLPRCV